MTAGGDPPPAGPAISDDFVVDERYLAHLTTDNAARDKAESDLAALERGIDPQLWLLRKLIIICAIASTLVGAIGSLAICVAANVLGKLLGFPAYGNGMLGAILFVCIGGQVFGSLWDRKIAIPLYKGVWQAPGDLLDRIRRLMQWRADLVYALRREKVPREPDLFPWSWLIVFIVLLFTGFFYLTSKLP